MEYIKMMHIYKECAWDQHYTYIKHVYWPNAVFIVCNLGCVYKLLHFNIIIKLLLFIYLLRWKIMSHHTPFQRTRLGNKKF